MEEIVRFEGQNDHNELISEVKFSKLELVSLPNLLSFYAKKEKMGSSSACAQLLFNVKVIFPVLYELSIAGVGVIEIWDKKSIAVFEAQGSFCQLKSVYIQSCSKLLHVFSSKMHPLLKELGWLHVKDCGKMEGIVGEVDEDGLRNEASFSKLAVLGLLGVIEIWDKKSIAVFEAQGSFCQLKSVYIQSCSKLLHVFSSKMHPLLKELGWLHQIGSSRFVGSTKPSELLYQIGKVDTTDGNSTVHAQPLFNEKDTFPLLQTLRLDEDLKAFYCVTKELPIGASNGPI
ncbi:hypothetical protein Vadar_011207 [Vaccinium darrowii]|uniref:Uncharacterized protein n=1 Tax=Vaccinium darrowii TaxID=229202 RepID=A0ACB7ZBE8_9ERIC|nr:hypothetical protein Vadar_011207 [Vaccinium darrowii]